MVEAEAEGEDMAEGEDTRAVEEDTREEEEEEEGMEEDEVDTVAGEEDGEDSKVRGTADTVRAVGGEREPGSPNWK